MRTTLSHRCSDVFDGRYTGQSEYGIGAIDQQPGLKPERSNGRTDRRAARWGDKHCDSSA